MKNLLQKLVKNSTKAIDDGIYNISEKIPQSKENLIVSIKNSNDAVLITEIKFSSPSLGGIRKVTNPVQIAQAMINGGAKALSVLTQPYLFNGSPQFFMEIRNSCSLPMLMKDIIVDKVQIDAAKKMGANMILLIQSLFDYGFLKEINDFVDYAHKNKLQVLLESHTLTEFKNAQKTNADILGVNNRNLDTLELDLNTTQKLLEGYNKKKPVISESGINTPQDIVFLHKSGANAFLVGSSIMKTDNIEENVRNLVNSLR